MSDNYYEQRYEVACSQMWEVLHKVNADLSQPLSEGRDCFTIVADALKTAQAENERLRECLERIECDPHAYSNRPCATCRQVSGLLGVRFGCVKKQMESESTKADQQAEGGGG